MKIYLIGIGGIAMGNLASMLKQIGHDVSGSDMNVYPPMSDKLEEWQIKYHRGFDERQVRGADLVIIGNAISRGNPELEYVLNSGMEYLSMPQAISRFFLHDKKVIVVAGTHGKTTTTFMVHYILKEIGLKPGLFVGGIRQDGHGGFEAGGGEYFVIEGDEYDSAFFDKASKFLHYRPYYLIMTAVDFDHADIFGSIDDILKMFGRLLRIVPSKGYVTYWQGSANLKNLMKDYSYSDSDAYDINRSDSLLKFEKGELVYQPTGRRLDTSIIGRHNYRNAEAVLRLMKRVFPDKTEKILSALEKFPGVKRRQEILYQSDNSVVMEDFAHHPVAISETVRAVRERYPGYKVISFFEPRSATSHRNIFQDDFAASFKGSSHVFISEVFNKNKVAGKNRLNVKKMITDIGYASAFYGKSPDELAEKFKKQLPELSGKKIVVLIMSNGAFGGIYSKITELVRGRDGSGKGN